MSDNDQKREYFRLIYPVNDRPTIEIEGEKYSVMDLSEEGVRFGHAPTVCLGIGSVVRGTIEFRDGSKEQVVGKIIRIVEEKPAFTVMQLTAGLPMKRMMDEQRALIRKYKS